MKFAQWRRTTWAMAPVLMALAASLSSPAAAADKPGNKGFKTFPIRTGAPVNIYIPSKLTDPERAPLVILLHGSSGTGMEALADSNLKATADKHGFLIAMPDGGIKLTKGFAWNIPGVPTSAGKLPSAADRDDVAYLTTVMNALIASGFADQGRIYIAGISGGARMASWLGCVASGRIAAIAPVVGLRAGNPLRGDPTQPDPETCKPTTAMPILAFSGDADPVNPINGGGMRYWQYPVSAAVSRWATLNGCNTTATAKAISGTVDEVRYGECRDGADVVSRTVKGGVHRWIADNDTIWKFFAAHSRGKAK